MSIPIEWDPEPDLRFHKSFSEKTQEAILEALAELHEAGIADHDDTKVIEHEDYGWIFVLTVKKERGGGTDHRVLFNYQDGKIVIRDVGHRDYIYK